MYEVRRATEDYGMYGAYHKTQGVLFGDIWRAAIPKLPNETLQEVRELWYREHPVRAQQRDTANLVWKHRVNETKVSLILSSDVF